MHQLYTLPTLALTPWFVALTELDSALAHADLPAAHHAYTRLYHALSERGASDLWAAAIADLLTLETPLSRTTLHGDPPEGLVQGLVFDLVTLRTLLGRNHCTELSRLGGEVPPLERLAHTPLDASQQTLRELLERGDDRGAVGVMLEHVRTHGTGLLARFEAFRWAAGELVGIAHPARPEMTRLVALEEPLDRLCHNIEAFLQGRPAHHTLLYGPRGSGKSTAVRALLPRYAAAGLRLIELPPAELPTLTVLLERLRFRPHRYALFVDDLTFDAGDASYSPLKTLLEGSLSARPENVLVIATSNRRHLVREAFSDRPDPSNDDIHGWDTHNERLALADRFGLTLTFPNATQTRYLAIVRGLAVQAGVGLEDLDARAIRFAEWGNGYSGRTAQQFIDSVSAV